MSLNREAEVSYARQREFELELTTRDGDRLKIRVEASESGGLAVRESAAAGPGFAAVAQESLFEQESRFEFRFALDGALDEDELGAINELLQRLGETANRFFEGDPQAAFEGLLSEGFNSDEIAGFAMEISQRTQVEVSYTERALAQYRAQQTESPRGLEGLGRYLEALSGARETDVKVQLGNQELVSLLGDLVEGLQAGRDVDELGQKEGDDQDNMLSQPRSALDAMNRQLLSSLELRES